MPGAAREQPRRGEREQRARRRSDHRLDDADEQQVAAGDRVDDAEQIGIQRRLVEHLVAEPVAAGDPLRPLVVAARVAHQHREERRPRGSARRARDAPATRRRRSRARTTSAGPPSTGSSDRPAKRSRLARSQPFFGGKRWYASPACLTEMKPRRARSTQRKRFSAISACSAVSSFACSALSVARAGAAAPHLHQRHRADHLDAAARRAIVPARSARSACSPTTMCGGTRRRSRRSRARRIMPPWKPVAGQGRLSGRAPADRCASSQSLQQWIAERRAGRRSPPIAAAAAELERRLAARHARPRRPHAERVHRAGRRHRRVPHLRDRRFRSPRRATSARSSSIRATRASCTTPTSASIARGRRASSTRAIPSPGYAGSMERDARYPEGQLLGWTPGQAPHPSPDGTQWRLEPGSDLVVQLHLQPTGKPEARRR